jgi:hypothetical protein
MKLLGHMIRIDLSIVKNSLERKPGVTRKMGRLTLK